MSEFQIIRSKKRKTCAIEVHRDQSVIIRAPTRMPEADIQRLVVSKADWIRRQQAIQATLPTKQPQPDFLAGSTFYFLGNPLQLAFSGCQQIRVSANQLHLPSRLESHPEKAELTTKEWYRSQAKQIFTARLEHWLPNISHWRTVTPTLRCRYMRRYWGSCNSKGFITLNIHMVKVPLELIDYVICHELCHLKVMHHNPDFYALQQELLPDWQNRRRQIRDWELKVLP